MADIISEIQQYQNKPYYLKPSTKIIAFLENFEPFPNKKNEATKIDDYL